MRNEALTGYLLHQRPYQEKRALYYLFSQQYGVVHGIGKKGAPLFEPLQLFATGKRDLKTFSQINLVQNILAQNSDSEDIVTQDIKPHNASFQEAQKSSEITLTEKMRYTQITGQQQYAALYINEVLWRLLPTEDPMPVLWYHYQDTLIQLKQSLSTDELRLCLRQFEHNLFQELGFALTLLHDSSLDVIELDADYRFMPDIGFAPIVIADNANSNIAQAVFNGVEIIEMAQMGITIQTLGVWSRLHRLLIDHLLEYQPLQSRLLWQQQQRYQ